VEIIKGNRLEENCVREWDAGDETKLDLFIAGE
jgi:hypothetical protein